MHLLLRNKTTARRRSRTKMTFVATLSLLFVKEYDHHTHTHHLHHTTHNTQHTQQDGNCLFNAVSQALHGTQNKQSQIRKEVCDHIEKYKDEYKCFVADILLDKYIEIMRRDGTWGGDLEICAMETLYGRSIRVYDKRVKRVNKSDVVSWSRRPNVECTYSNISTCFVHTHTKSTNREVLPWRTHTSLV